MPRVYQSLGGWWRIADETELKGGINVAFECGSGSSCYLAAMDNGRFTIGGPHAAGEEPNPEEVSLKLSSVLLGVFIFILC